MAPGVAGSGPSATLRFKSRTEMVSVPAPFAGASRSRGPAGPRFAAEFDGRPERIEDRNCFPAASRSPHRPRRSNPLRYGDPKSWRPNASARPTTRASSGISSPRRTIRIARAVPALHVPATTATPSQARNHLDDLGAPGHVRLHLRDSDSDNRPGSSTVWSSKLRFSRCRAARPPRGEFVAGRRDSQSSARSDEYALTRS